MQPQPIECNLCRPPRVRVRQNEYGSPRLVGSHPVCRAHGTTPKIRSDTPPQNPSKFPFSCPHLATGCLNYGSAFNLPQYSIFGGCDLNRKSTAITQKIDHTVGKCWARTKSVQSHGELWSVHSLHSSSRVSMCTSHSLPTLKWRFNTTHFSQVIITFLFGL